MLKRLAVASSVLLVLGCSSPETPSKPTSVPKQTTASTSKTAAPRPAPRESRAADQEVKRVTVGVFKKEEDGSYKILPQELTFEVGVPCFTWSRTAQPHDEGYGPAGTLEESDEVHEHFNATITSSFENGKFSYVEIGPEHSLEAIQARCAAAKPEDGVAKVVSETEYFEDKPGIYLKIVDVE